MSWVLLSFLWSVICKWPVINVTLLAFFIVFDFFFFFRKIENFILRKKQYQVSNRIGKSLFCYFCVWGGGGWGVGVSG